MECIKKIFFCGFLSMLFINTALSQEKPKNEDSNMPRDAVEKKSKESEPPVIFGSWRSGPTKEAKRYIYKNHPPVIKDLKLDKTTMMGKCSLPEGSETSESENSLEINAFTEAADADNDILLYKYEVSGGKIIGEHEKVVWDLTGVKAGTYTIKVAVDDGCDYCGNTITKTVVIVENTDCH